MTPIRFVLYFLDALHLRQVVAGSLKTDAEAVIFDRYLYDELANLDLHTKLARLYSRFLLRLVPHPDVANLLDADPAEARRRKPEYPLEFIHRNRASYLTLSSLVGGINVIEARTIAEVHRLIMEEVSKKLSLRESAGMAQGARPSEFLAAEQTVIGS
jgi:thymidylate kinase